MNFQIQDIQDILACWCQRDIRERVPQIAHRMELAQLWNIHQGDHLLEVGCGQGDATTVLAAAVGKSGHIVAVDKASSDSWKPSLEKAHALIMSTPLGAQIEFRTSTDLLHPEVLFPEKAFDVVIFSHSSWYFSEPEELFQLFMRVRPWAKRLGYAEWDIFPRNIMQVPHMLSILLQVHLKAFKPQMSLLNVHSLILPQDVYQMAERAGWKVIHERQVDSSTLLWDGKDSEIRYALKLAEEFVQDEEKGVSEYARDFINTEKKLLSRIAKETQMMSLSTYAFLAE